ncbi:MAG: HD-GYP domain-containing protein, partial [Solirubrobacterales bacterium]
THLCAERLSMGSRSKGTVTYFPQAVAATAAVVGFPIVAAIALRSSGLVASRLLLVVIAVALSIAASYAGAAYWKARRQADELLFGELMIWGWIRRFRADRLIASAEELLGPTTQTAKGGPSLSSSRRARLLEQLSKSLEARDPYTHGHSRRVARHAGAIAQRLGLTEAQVTTIRAAAAIHDVGKVETPPEILNKPGPLTEEEYEIVKLHAAAGARMASGLGNEDLTAIVRHHHERLDGNGYPDGLVGDQIPLGARIVAVADTFDALTSRRPYRPAMAHREALALLDEEAGTHLDRDAVKAFRHHYSGHRRVAVWALVVNGPRQLLQGLLGQFGAGNAVTAAKVTAASLAAIAAASAATSTHVSAQRRSHPSASRSPHSEQARRAQPAAGNVPTGSHGHSTEPQPHGNSSPASSGGGRAGGRDGTKAAPSPHTAAESAPAPASGTHGGGSSPPEPNPPPPDPTPTPNPVSEAVETVGHAVEGVPVPTTPVEGVVERVKGGNLGGG